MKNNIDYYIEIAKEIRRKILRLHYVRGTSHIASSLSCVDILVALYFKILKIKNPNDINRDRFILSKGHAVSALYATLAERKYFDEKLLEKYCCNGGFLPGHSTKGSVAGIEVTTGSLGHGLPLGVGMALAAKRDNRSYRVFVLMSDGECEEGSVWEASLFATKHKLDNLIVIVDYNKIQAFGNVKDILDLEPFKEKWKTFGWEVKEINGHNFKEIFSVLNKLPFVGCKPSVVIAHTIKGKGISFMENRLEWHYKSPNKEELELALKELDK